MLVTDEMVNKVVAYCTSELPPKENWLTPDGYPDSLGLCVIDAIYSTGSHYTSVVNVVRNYVSEFSASPSVSDLVESFNGDPRAWAELVKNRKPAHTRENAPLKSEVVMKAAELLKDMGIETVPDLVERIRVEGATGELHDAWKRLPSQSSGVTYNYLLILAGLPSVKPDRMVLRFLESALDVPAEAISNESAVEILSRAAEKLGVSARDLDHMAWRHASGRELDEAVEPK